MVYTYKSQETENIYRPVLLIVLLYVLLIVLLVRRQKLWLPRQILWLPLHFLWLPRQILWLGSQFLQGCYTLTSTIWYYLHRNATVHLSFYAMYRNAIFPVHVTCNVVRVHIPLVVWPSRIFEVGYPVPSQIRPKFCK